MAGNGKRRRGWVPAQASDGGFGPPPHPVAARSGQRYWPRSGKRKRPFQIGRIDRSAGTATGRRLDGAGEKVALKLARLLAIRDDGHGEHYAFCGFEERRYKTYAYVASLDGDESTLVMPEWHPARPVAVRTRALPFDVEVGQWFACTADLGQGRAAWLNVADYNRCADPGPEHCHRSTYMAPEPAPARPRPTVGVDCGDIVLELAGGSGLSMYQLRGGLLDVYVQERPGTTGRGDRVYLAEDGAIATYLVVEKTEIRPHGMFMRCQPEPIALTHAIPVKGRSESEAWAWRWWPRELEDGDPALLRAAANAVELDEVRPDYVWSLRTPPTHNDLDCAYRVVA